MEELLALILGLGLVAATSFWLGYTTRKERNEKFHREITKAYQDLIQQNERLKDSPTAIARSAGFGEGYEQGVADSHRAVEKLIHGVPSDEDPS